MSIPVCSARTAADEADDGRTARKYAGQTGPPVYPLIQALPGIIAARLPPDVAAKCRAQECQPGRGVLGRSADAASADAVLPHCHGA
jgi:hypothetical protein